LLTAKETEIKQSNYKSQAKQNPPQKDSQEKQSKASVM
jgi:hypothetical protein